MPEDYERLQKKIEDGLEAVRELKKLAAEEDRRKRPKLKLIKGGLLVGALWAGVEWFRSYKRIAVALAATGITATGAVIAEQPHSPGADPPAQAITQPADPRPSVPPSSTPRPVAPTPRRTSPPRTTELSTRARPPTGVAAPTAKPAVPRVTVNTAPPRTQAPVKPSGRPPTKPPVKVPKVPFKPVPTKPVQPSTPIVSIPATPTVPPIIETPTEECVTITVLGICILG